MKRNLAARFGPVFRRPLRAEAANLLQFRTHPQEGSQFAEYLDLKHGSAHGQLSAPYRKRQIQLRSYSFSRNRRARLRRGFVQAGMRAAAVLVKTGVIVMIRATRILTRAGSLSWSQ